LGNDFKSTGVESSRTEMSFVKSSGLKLGCSLISEIDITKLVVGSTVARLVAPIKTLSQNFSFL